MCGFCPLEIDNSVRGITARIGLGLMHPFVPNVVRLIFQNSPFGRLDLTDENRLDMLLKQVAASKPRNAAEKVERDAMKKDPGGVLRA